MSTRLAEDNPAIREIPDSQWFFARRQSPIIVAAMTRIDDLPLKASGWRAGFMVMAWKPDI